MWPIGLGVIIFIAAYVALFLWITPGIVENKKIDQEGIQTTGISTGDYHKATAYRGGGGYKAFYKFEVDGKTYIATGNKQYPKSENIKGGITATIKYLKEDPDQNKAYDL